MARLSRCNHCQGFLHHDFISLGGIDVYRCTRETLFNDKGRFFIISGAAGTVEVTPVSTRAGWDYEVVNVERERLKTEKALVEAELETRRRLFMEAQNRQMARFKRFEEDDEDE